MKFTTIIHWILIAFSFFFSAHTLAETIGNYNDCDACPGQIHYGPEEARKILGTKGLELLRKMDRSNKRVLIDLDGVLKNTLAPKPKIGPDSGYEILVNTSPDFIYIESVIDDSFIQILPDDNNAQTFGRLENWFPQIFLQAALRNRIDLKDIPEVAWKKMEASEIYQWVFREKEKSVEDQLSEKIRFVFEALSNFG